MKFSRELVRYAEDGYARRKEAFGARLEAVEQELKGGTEEEALLLKFLYATMPLVDVGDYSPALFSSFVRHALRLREEFSWCACLPEPLFLLQVLAPRVNTEELADCRGLFYDKLAHRVRGLSLPEAILEANRWCAEQVTYRSTDERTASPLAVYRCGYGRCGEESAFVAAVLRSIGIAARQVYAPWWSHCDDNHAWVEAYDGTQWKFLGACEPEPVLNRGWFLSASSRAMFIHARAFVQGSEEEVAFLFPGRDRADFSLREGVAYETVTARYAETRVVTVTVTRDGKPVSGAEVLFEILNMARFSEITRQSTDGQGQVVLRLGLGSVRVTARKNGFWAEAEWNVTEAGALELALVQQGPPNDRVWDFTMTAPADSPKHSGLLEDEQKRERRACLDAVAALRAVRLEQQENIPPQEAERLPLSLLTEKDREGGVATEILQDSLTACRWREKFPESVFLEALFRQRIYLEVLTPYRAYLSDYFTREEKQAFLQSPLAVWRWIEREVLLQEDCYSALCGTPAGAVELRGTTRMGQRVLFVAVCRSLGIPARLSEIDLVAEYWKDGGFCRVDEQKESAGLVLSAPENRGGLAGQNYTLARWQEQGFLPVTAPNIPQGERRALSLLPGTYRLTTASRMPGGTLFAREQTFSLTTEVQTELALSLREGNISDMLSHYALPSFVLKTEAGEERDSGALLANGANLLVWLEVNREPTEHILNELREHGEEFRGGAAGQPPCSLHFILTGGADKSDPTLQKTLQELPSAQIWQDDFQETVPMLARRLYVDPERLPLILLAQENVGVFATCGYNVGTAELLLRMLSALGRQ